MVITAGLIAAATCCRNGQVGLTKGFHKRLQQKVKKCWRWKGRKALARFATLRPQAKLEAQSMLLRYFLHAAVVDGAEVAYGPIRRCRCSFAAQPHKKRRIHFTCKYNSIMSVITIEGAWSGQVYRNAARRNSVRWLWSYFIKKMRRSCCYYKARG